MNTEKSFVTCFDKDCEEYAEILMTLVSADKTLCNIKKDKKEFDKDRSIVSGEYVLTIGKKGSEYNRQNFKDEYNNYGIHFGYYGAKAWIYCEKFEWDRNSIIAFNKEVLSLRKKLVMDTNKKEHTIKPLKKVTWLSVVSKVFNPLGDIIEKLREESRRLKKQYRFAVPLFCYSYLHDFLGIKEEQNEEQNF